LLNHTVSASKGCFAEITEVWQVGFRCKAVSIEGRFKLNLPTHRARDIDQLLSHRWRLVII